jgi:DNA-binding NtrC family response regulator
MKNEINILIVDDELAMRNLLENILIQEGYNIGLAENGDDALKMIKNNKYDLVLSDIKMPGMNGFELLKIIKSEHPGIGVIMMTGFGDAFTVKDALLQGADEYITKPFKAHEITLVLERTYMRRRIEASGD